MDTDLEISHRAIRNARMRRGLSVVEAAERAGMAPKTLYDIEKGETIRTRMSTLRKLADALGCGVDEFLVAVPVVPAGEGAA